MRKKFVYSLIVIALSFSLSAQKTMERNRKPCSCAFSSINQLGLAVGELNEAFQIQTVNGIRYKTWFAGIGLGLDEYRFRSVPLFFDLRKELWKKPNVLFLYSDIGINYPWVKTEQKIFWGPSDFEKGLYFDGGLGYKIKLKKQAILFSGGFSLKKLSENRTSFFCPFAGPCQQTKDAYNYSMERVSLKFGLWL